MMLAAMSSTLKRARHGGALKLHREIAFGEVSKVLHQPQSPAIPPIPRTDKGAAVLRLTHQMREALSNG